MHLELCSGTSRVYGFWNLEIGWDRTEVRTEPRLASVTDRALGQYFSLVCAPARARLFANPLSLTRVCSSWGSGPSVPVPEPVPQGWFPGSQVPSVVRCRLQYSRCTQSIRIW